MDGNLYVYVRRVALEREQARRAVGAERRRGAMSDPTTRVRVMSPLVMRWLRARGLGAIEPFAHRCGSDVVPARTWFATPAEIARGQAAVTAAGCRTRAKHHRAKATALLAKARELEQVARGR